ncbi:MAG: GNAT family N-acetyltransferase [Alphaproteobacteria bacterium]
MYALINAADCTSWRSVLSHFGEIDCTYLPEYHLAYSLRIKNSEALLWHFTSGNEHFIYPFLLTPVMIADKPTGHYDISGIYGYTGPIATTRDTHFLKTSWQAFDAYTAEKNIITEFVRFSPFNKNEVFAHPDTKVEANRTLAASILPKTEGELLSLLGSKTRNMLRKAEREGLTARELSLPEYLPAFRHLYADTMTRNNAPEFFWYDDAYWNHMLSLGKNGLRLFGAFAGENLVAVSMAVVHGICGLYHLGASLPEYARLGAGNLSLFAMSRALMESGITFVNMTGGRSTAADDPLLLFKKSNATSTATFYIGKRIIDTAAYAHMVDEWKQHTGIAPDSAKIIFWR